MKKVKSLLAFFSIMLFLNSCSTDNKNKDIEIDTENISKNRDLVQVGTYENGVYSSYDDLELRGALQDLLEDELGIVTNLDDHWYEEHDSEEVSFQAVSSDGSVSSGFPLVIQNEKMFYEVGTLSTTCVTTDCSSSPTECQRSYNREHNTFVCTPCDGDCSRTSSDQNIVRYLSASFIKL
ncbi:MAG: hypothetical protein ABR595_03740 [Psychroflexus sp.]